MGIASDSASIWVATLARILAMLQNPFDEQPDNEEFAAPPPPQLCDLSLSCSS